VRLRISVFGLGYVGSVTVACLAQAGHHVIGVDVNSFKVETLQSGRSPITEPGTNQLVAEACAAGRLRATTDAHQAIHESDISFVCVSTPSQRTGKLDLNHVMGVAQEIGTALRDKPGTHTVVLRSTVLPGTTEASFIPALENASGRRADHDFTVCYNPEFMREGSAVADFSHPPYTILGARKPADVAQISELYKHLPSRMYVTSIPVAEMTKYASNAFHAVKVAFANEIGTLCKHLGVETNLVKEIFTSDTKLNVSPAYLSPGFAFGGSCLPKDLRALTYQAKALDLHVPLLESVLRSNQEHLNRAMEAIVGTGKKKIGMLGLSFKAGTDDLRESPQVELIKRLLGEGYQVRVWDPEVSLGRLVGSNRAYIEEVIPHVGSLLLTDLADVLRDAEIIVVAVKSVPKADLLRHLNPSHTVIDFVNLDPSDRLATDSSHGICW
jgi:GDP-mannose 6-dehydrogenase